MQLAAHIALQRRGLIAMTRVFAFSVLLVALAFATGSAADSAKGAQPFKEPVILSSKDGILEVTLTPRQTTATLDTVAEPVKNMLLFDYSVQRGSSSDGQMSGGHMYPAPTLHVEPGERLIIHINNEQRNLSIPDFYDPKYTPVGQTVPKYPTMLTAAPFNLHVHGAHVSPRGNADNVLLHIDAGMSNTYVYDIPKNMTPGTYWYHSHLHTLTAMQTYFGLAGMLLVGRADSDIPLVTQKNIPIRTMLLQYNTVFDRQGGMSQMTNPNWPQWVSTLIKPTGDQLAKGTYRPLLAPVNFLQSKKGTQWATVWYTGPLSIENKRGRFQFIPSNLQRFTPFDKDGPVVKANLKLPDYERDTQFTVNGQFEPVLNVKPGQTEIWVLANVSDIAYMNVRLTETATGNHPKIAIVGQDGIAYGRSRVSARDGRHRVADSAGIALRDRRHHAGQRGAAYGIAGSRFGRARARSARYPVHQRRYEKSAGSFGLVEYTAGVDQLRRRLFHVPVADASQRRARGRARRYDRIRSGAGVERTDPIPRLV